MVVTELYKLRARTKARAFGMIELLVVIAILVLLAALLTPVYQKARASAAEATSKSNLRQIYLQTMLYVADYDGAPYGTSFQMGLPPIPQPERLSTLVKLKPPQAPHPLSKTIGTSYYSNYSDPGLDNLPQTWREYSEKFQGDSVLYIDPFNNDPDKPLHVGPFYRRKMIAVNLNGSVIVRFITGDWDARNWK